MKYYAFIDGEQKGPFELDELVAAGVRPTTYIWCKGMDDWQEAQEVPEVCRLYRQHIAEMMHPSLRRTDEPSINPGVTITPQPTDDHQPTQAEDADLEDVPLQFRRYVQKSGTKPGPSLDTSPDINQPPQVSLTLAILSMLLCFVPTGIAAVVFSYKAQKTWLQAQSASGEQADRQKAQAHDYARSARMWIGITVSFGLIFMGFLFSQNFK